MKKDDHSKNVLKTISESLKFGLPIAAIKLKILGCRDDFHTSGVCPCPDGVQSEKDSTDIVEAPVVEDKAETLTDSPTEVPPEKIPSKVIAIDAMSLSHRIGSTPGMFYPLPWKIQVAEYTVKQGDTWESVAKRNAKFARNSRLNPLEILLRVNDVSPKETLDILSDPKSKLEALPLTPGQTIYVPVKIVKDERFY